MQRALTLSLVLPMLPGCTSLCTAPLLSRLPAPRRAPHHAHALADLGGLLPWKARPARHLPMPATAKNLGVHVAWLPERSGDQHIRQDIHLDS